MRVKVEKFILIPVLSIFNNEEELVDEKKLKAVQVYTGKGIDLREISIKLEELYARTSESQKT